MEMSLKVKRNENFILNQKASIENQLESQLHNYTLKYSTPLEKATHLGDYDLVQKLIVRGENINSKGKNDTTLLHIAAGCGHDLIVELLIKHNIKINEKNTKSYTPLHLAIWKLQENSVKILINKLAIELPEALEQPTIEGWTPIYLASMRGNLQAIKLLEQSGLSVLTPVSDGSTCLHAAAKYLKIDVLKYFFDKFEEKDLTAVDHYGKNAFSYLEDKFIESNDLIKIIIYNLIKNEKVAKLFNKTLIDRYYKKYFQDNKLTIDELKNSLKNEIADLTKKSKINAKLEENQTNNNKIIIHDKNADTSK